MLQIATHTIRQHTTPNLSVLQMAKQIKTSRHEFQLTSSEYAVIQEYATKLNKTINRLARDLILETATKDLHQSFEDLVQTNPTHIFFQHDFYSTLNILHSLCLNTPLRRHTIFNHTFRAPRYDHLYCETTNHLWQLSTSDDTNLFIALDPLDNPDLTNHI